MKAIFKKEFASFFKSPLGFVFIGVFEAIFGIYFVMTVYSGVAEYGAYVLNGVSSFLIFLLPLLSMRSLSEESKNRTDQMLLTAPIKSWDIILGKFFAQMVVVVIALAVTFIQPLVLVVVYSAAVDWAVTICGYIGIVLLCAILLAIGMFISSLTDSQLIAAIATIALFLVLTLLNGVSTAFPTDALFSFVIILIILLAVTFILYKNLKAILPAAVVGGVLIVGATVVYFVYSDFYEGLLATIVSWLNPMTRYWALYDGVLKISTVVFFFAASFFFLFLANQRLEKKRWA